MAGAPPEASPVPEAAEPPKSEIDLLFDRGHAIIAETRKLLASFAMPTLGPAPAARRPKRRRPAPGGAPEPKPEPGAA